MIHDIDKNLDIQCSEIKKKIEYQKEGFKQTLWIDKTALVRLDQRSKTIQKISEYHRQFEMDIQAQLSTWRLCLEQRVCPSCGGELKANWKPRDAVSNIDITKADNLKCADCKKEYDIPEPLPVQKPMSKWQVWKIWFSINPLNKKKDDKNK